MPKINVYLPDELADAVRDAQLPVSSICQAALERAVRDVSTLRGTDLTSVGEPTHGPFVRFNPRARRAIAGGQQHAQRLRHGYVGTEHLLLGLLDEEGNLALKILTSLDVDPEDLRQELVASMPRGTKRIAESPPFHPIAKQALELTTKESLTLGHNYVGCEHLLLGLLAAQEGLARQVLRRMGLELRTTRRAVDTALAGFLHANQRQRDQAVDASTLSEILDRLSRIEERLDTT